MQWTIIIQCYGVYRPLKVNTSIIDLQRNLKNSKTGGSDGIVGELLKYGGFGMVDLLEQLFSVIWQEEIVPRQWREGLIVNNNIIFKKGDREDPANYRGITLLSIVGKVFCKILNNSWCSV